MVTQKQSKLGSPDLSFINELQVSDVVRFLIIAITGESTVRAFLNALEPRFSHANVECQILLRAQYSVDKKRSKAFENTIRELKGFRARHATFQFEVRTYSTPTPLLAVLCEHKDRTYSGLLSSYVWRNPNSRERFSEVQTPVARRDRADLDVNVYLSWFEHFWGSNQIHTVLFDFDDTLFQTTDAQVQAWVDAVQFGLTRRSIAKADFRNAQTFEKLRNKRDAFDVMKNIFLDEQDEGNIARRLFKEPRIHEILDIIRPKRLMRREQLTIRTAKPIAGVVADVKHLSRRYQLVIVSATSETIIDRVLEDNEIYFSYVLGRDLVRPRWQSVETKAQHFIYVSSMLGVPLDRMVFVGDSDSDFKAAGQVGIHFIENRYNAAQCGRSSLIKSKSERPTYFVSPNAGPGELIAAIEKIEADIRSQR